jgi:hypothetical protein
MRVLWLVALLTVSVGLGLAGGSAEAPKKGLLIHEWGVINVYEDVDLANADRRAAWDALPKFVFGNVDRRQVPEQELRVVLAPVIYIHSAFAETLQVRVEFPGGRPAVWWPANANRRRNPDGAWRNNYLDWLVEVRQPADRTRIRIPEGHWMAHLRQVKAADLHALDDFHESSAPYWENFIYYDGLIPSTDALSIRVAHDALTLSNRARHAVHDVTVIDRREPGVVRVGRVARIDAGAQAVSPKFTRIPSKDWPQAGVSVLIRQLSEAGLFEDEAKAMAEVWRKDFFETEGLTLFYRLPQEEYDRLLPLEVKPRTPEKTVRVMLFHHPHCEPDLGERVMALVRQLDSSKFQERLEAHRRLQALGRAAFVHLLRARNARPNLEVKARLNKLLEEFESERGFGD